MHILSSNKSLRDLLVVTFLQSVLYYNLEKKMYICFDFRSFALIHLLSFSRSSSGRYKLSLYADLLFTGQYFKYLNFSLVLILLPELWETISPCYYTVYCFMIQYLCKKIFLVSKMTDCPAGNLQFYKSAEKLYSCGSFGSFTFQRQWKHL